ncbi:MAG: serine/threonine protein kinase [Deltaproteobacteria bacterium]|nr:serine/threonine protein kinase [Deltaproteobacteria bacterium]
MIRDSQKETAERGTSPADRETETSERATFEQLPVGTELGRYVILGARGAGGMGIVYAAYDPKLDRKVALKLVRRDADHREADARLLREAQAMAKLAHPNVVTVHDAAVIGDAICIEMEFVEGATLEEHTRGKTWQEILDVYRQAGRALAAAHEKGLVHRDFKPTNALVDVTGRVRVLDFGLARAAEDDGEAPELERESAVASTEIATSSVSLPTLPRTMTGLSAGTPAFMPPEQWRGKPVDGRADQYAFAASLFDALYETLPFPRASYAAMKSAAARGSIAERPKGTQVPAWVDRVLVKALAFDPGDRYPSMGALLDALAGDLAAAKRRRIVAAIAAVTALALAIVGVKQLRAKEVRSCAADHRLGGVWDEPKKAAVRAAITKSGSAGAAQAWAKTSALLDGYASAWVAMRTATCEDRRKDRSTDGATGAKLVCLDARLQELRVLTDVLAKDSEVVHESVTAASKLPPLSECANASLRRRPAPPKDADRFAKAEAIHSKILEADALRAAGRPKAARPIAAAAVEEARDPPIRAMEARGLFVLGRAEHEDGDYKGSAVTLEKAVWAAEAAGDDETVLEATTLLAFVTGYRLSDAPAGARWTSHALASLERYGGSDFYAAELDRVRSSNARQRKDLDESLRLAEAAVAGSVRARGPDDVHVGLAELNLANTYTSLARLDDAMAHYQRTRKIFEAALGPSHPTCASPIVNEAIIARRRGEPSRAVALYDEALAVYVAAHGPTHPDALLVMSNRALALAAMGRFEEARETFAKVLELRRKSLGNAHPMVASTLGNLAWTQRKTKRLAEAHVSIDEALAIHEKGTGTESGAIASVLIERGYLALDEGKPKEALPLVTRALAVREKKLGKDHPDVATALTSLGRVHVALGEAGRAIEPLERAVALLGKDSPRDKADAQLWLARALRALDRDPGRALTLAREAEATLAKDESTKEDLEEVRTFLSTNERWLGAR